MDINGKIIMLGDTHFGSKRFSEEVQKSKMRFIKEQLLPYMKENNIKNILQLGDLFDNRVNMNINFFYNFLNEFTDLLEKLDINLYVITGNHDIYFKESRKVGLLPILDRLYSNFYLINDRTYANINNSKCYLVSWLLETETLTLNELKDVEYIFGHFEIRDFQLSKGILDKSSKLSNSFFDKLPNLKAVYSGHYHIKDSKGKINYIGTPFQLSYSDFKELKGFYVIDENNNLEFIENKISPKYSKIYWNSFEDFPIEYVDTTSKKFKADELSELSDLIGESNIQIHLISPKNLDFIALTEHLANLDIAFTITDDYTFLKLGEDDGLLVNLENQDETKNLKNNENRNNKKHTKTQKLNNSKDIMLEALNDKNPKLVPVVVEIMKDLNIV